LFEIPAEKKSLRCSQRALGNPLWSGDFPCAGRKPLIAREEEQLVFNLLKDGSAYVGAEILILLKGGRFRARSHFFSREESLAFPALLICE